MNRSHHLLKKKNYLKINWLGVFCKFGWLRGEKHPLDAAI